ncbi:MAG: glycosyltransferase family 4 protein [bacterium]
MKRRPKILFYSDVFEPAYSGGLVTSLKRIATSLSMRKMFNVHLLTYDPRLAKRGTRCCPEGYTVHGHGRGEGNIAYLYIQSATKAIVELHRELKFDLFIAFFAHMPLLAVATASKAVGVPYVVCARGSDVNVNMEEDLHRKVMRDYFRDAAAVVCVSEEMARKLTKWKIMPRGTTISSVLNAIDPEPFDVAYRQKAVKQSEYDFLFVGTARPVKRFDVVLRAMDTLNVRGRCARLAAVLLPHRRYRGLVDDYRKEAKERGIDGHVAFFGPRSFAQLRRLYASSRCILLSSDSEGMSNILLEGMASGCYVIARDRCMPQHLIGARNRTFSTENQLVNAMEEMLGAPDGCVEENRKLVCLYHSLSAEAAAYRKMFYAAMR